MGTSKKGKNSPTKDSKTSGQVKNQTQTTQVDTKCLLLIKSDKWSDSNLLITQRLERHEEGVKRVNREKSTNDQWFPDSVRSEH